MPTYSKKDFERIAAAIGKHVADVMRHEKIFEAAAIWYRLYHEAPIGERITPFRMRKRMTEIASAAERLLKHLGVSDPADAPDGPALAVLEVLASADDGTEDAVIQATARLGRLVELLEAIDATRELGHLARQGAADVERLGKLTVPKEHQGEAAVNNWIAAMLSIYKQITGKEPGTSVIAPGSPRRGKAAGPLIRFLTAAENPLGLKHSDESLRDRVRDILRNGRRRKK